MSTATINCTEYEIVTDPTDGVSLSTGEVWWGTAVKYRKVGARRWQRLNAVDVHSWDIDTIIRMIDYQENP